MGRVGMRKTGQRAGARVVVVVARSCWSHCSRLVPAPAGAAAKGPPSPPRSVRPFPGNGSATLKWHAPDHLNGSPVTQWAIIAYNNRDTPLPTRIFTSPKTTYVYPGLSNSREYTFTVAARNRKGWSGASARSDPVKIGVPGRPGKPKAVPGVGRAKVTWKTPPGSGAFVKAYVVTPYLDGRQARARRFNSPKTTQVITGLKRHKRYAFTVTARQQPWLEQAVESLGDDHHQVGGGRPDTRPRWMSGFERVIGGGRRCRDRRLRGRSTRPGSIAVVLDLRVEDVIVLHDSNKLTLRLLPCDVVARVADAGQEALQFEVDVARSLAATGCPVASLEPRVALRVDECDGFVVSLWRYYEPAAPRREISSVDYAAALARLHAGLRTLDVATPHFTDRVAEAQRARCEP